MDRNSVALNEESSGDAQNCEGMTFLLPSSIRELEEIRLKLLNEVEHSTLTDNKGRAALHLAYINNFTNLFEGLIRDGININIQDNKRLTLLHMVCSDISELIRVRHSLNYESNENRLYKKKIDVSELEKMMDVVTVLMNKNADVNILNIEGKSPLDIIFDSLLDHLFGQRTSTLLTDTHSFRLKKFKSTWLLINSKKKVLHQVKEMFSLLISKLLKGRANYNITYNLTNYSETCQSTLLHVACLIGFESVIHILLDGGADACILDEEGNTCLHYFLSYWISCNDFTDSSGSLIMKKLLDSGININLVDKSGCTFLHFLAKVYPGIPGVKDVVLEELIKLGADVNAKDVNGQTPLHVAYSSNVARILLENGADVDARDSIDRTPIYNAIRFTSLIDELLCRNASVNVHDLYGLTPLHVTHSRETFVKLVEKSADINATDKKGKTPLHSAIFSFSPCIVEELLSRQANVNAQDERGKTPLHTATSSKLLIDIFGHMLLKKGALASIEDEVGLTPLDNALALCNCNISKVCSSIRFLRNLISLVHQGLHPVVELRATNTDKAKFYRMRCEQECLKMKSTRYGRISLLDVLGSHTNPVYVLNKSLETSITDESFIKQFPLYAHQIIKNFAINQERYKLMESANVVLTQLWNSCWNNSCKCYLLPEELKLHILSYLKDEELKSLIKS